MAENTPTVGTKPGGIKGIFIGSKGLRAGWGILIFIAIVAALVFGLNLALHAILHGRKLGADAMTPVGTLIIESILAAIAVVATLLTAAIERRSLVRLGFGLKNALPRLLQGLVVGVLAMAGLAGILVLCHAITFGGFALHGSNMWRYGGEWGAAFLLVGVFEELTFRGYVQQTLARGLTFRWSALILGGLFILAHAFNKGESPIGLVMVFVAGLVLSYSIWRTGALWWAIGFHAAWDWMQSFTFGVADSGYPAVDALMTSKPAGPDWLSGGTTGPEGSVLALLVLAIVVLVIHLTLRKPDEDMGVNW